MIDPNNLYFYFIFLAQILLASWYIPNKLLLRMKTVMEKYPPEQYPKLYAGSIQGYKILQQRYQRLNSVIFTLGFSLLSAIIMWDYSTQGRINEMIPWAYFMLQMVPVMYLEVKEIKYFKAMRNSNTNTKKVATIAPRKLFDFLPPKLFVLAIIMMLVAFSLAIKQYGFKGNAIESIIIIFATNLFFTGIIFWNIYGKKQDPYQSSEDRLKIIKITVKSLVYISIGVSIFLSVQMLIKIFDLNYLKTSVMSIYCQLILWISIGTRLKQIKIDDIDFSVYKTKNESSDIESAQ